jgi:hypothetical protein
MFHLLLYVLTSRAPWMTSVVFHMALWVWRLCISTVAHRGLRMRRVRLGPSTTAKHSIISASHRLYCFIPIEWSSSQQDDWSNERIEVLRATFAPAGWPLLPAWDINYLCSRRKLLMLFGQTWYSWYQYRSLSPVIEYPYSYLQRYERQQTAVQKMIHSIIQDFCKSSFPFPNSLREGWNVTRG